MKTGEKCIIAALSLFACVGLAWGAKKLFKKAEETPETPEENPNEERKKSRRILVVNENTKDISVVVLEQGEEIEDKTLVFIDTLSGDFTESNLLRSFKAKRNTVKMKEAKLDVGEITDLWFRVKERIDNITPDQIAETVREACDKKLGEQH